MGWTDTIDLIAREAALFAGLGLLIGGLDDLAVDLIWWARRWRHGRRAMPDVASLTAPQKPGRLVILIPAWDEATVIAPMLMTALRHWGAADFRILVGTYPNDPATIAAVRWVAEHDDRVHPVIGPRPGPTTKADCLNTLWRALAADPALAAAKAVVLHDAEDVVHQDELIVFDALIERAAVVQLPVIPLIHPGSWISATYADDFAQAHANQLVVRTAMGAGMPLAGTGCAIAMPTLAALAAGRRDGPFDPASLVEDYELGLRIAAGGGTALFARIADGTGAPVAVRAYFPATLAAAVRQKARWITGIALAGWDRTGWSQPLALIDHWWRIRDRRTPLAMLVVAMAWLAVPLWIASVAAHFRRGDHPPPLPDAVTVMLWVNAGLLGWRLAMRGWFTAQAYGWRQGLAAMPRMLVGNIVNLLAAGCAIADYAASLRGRPLVWRKTDHAFPDRVP